MTCWRCGAPWRCSKCGSFEQRNGHKGCAECHRRRARERAARKALERDQFEDIVITPAVSVYLEAFTAYLTASKTGDPRALHEAMHARCTALDALEGPTA